MINSAEYWRRREEENLKHYKKNEAEFDKEIKKIYENQLSEVQTQINAFYGKYAKAEKITLAEAKKRSSAHDVKAFEKKAAKYVEEKNFSKQANEELRLYNATMKINRLEMLKANIGLELISGHDELDKFMGEVLKGRTMEELERQAGILGKTVLDNARLAEVIPNASFHNANFSSRIWMHQDLLKSDISKLLQSGLIQGKNPRVLARDLKKSFSAKTSDLERLMRTELARVQTEAQKESFKRNGFDEFMFIANGDCCDMCKPLNGKHFKVEKMMPGTNAPPMHPNCRCSTAAYEGSAEYEAWLDYLDKGGSTEEWNDYAKAERKKSLANSGSSSIIKAGAISGARNPYGDLAKEHAHKYYGLVRKMTTDVSKIAETSGMTEKEIQDIKNFIFIKKHDLGGVEPELFEPDYMMAQSWQRLIDGKPEKHDLILLKHEQMEIQLMRQGMSQEEAHIETSKIYNYDKEAHKFYDKIKKYKD